MRDERNTESEPVDPSTPVSRRHFVGAGVAAAALSASHGRLELGSASAASRNLSHEETRMTQVPAFELEEATIDDLQSRMRSGRNTSASLVQLYLQRIDAIDQRGPAINCIIELNPDAASIAAQMDAERKAGKLRGPLHGIPVLIKDNIDTADRMHTTAGSLALADNIAARDSGVAERLRAAGAVILGKTNLSEWANFRSTHSTSGWSGRGGQTHNPYALDRTPSGSSSGSGSASASSCCAIAIGTETDGSVTSPSAAAGLVGIKPTVGLISRAGIIPISHTQDTAGPMA
ncbi:MAG TPA: amidase family protein, partial [Gemmatimonadaceae bacterium]